MSSETFDHASQHTQPAVTDVSDRQRVGTDLSPSFEIAAAAAAASAARRTAGTVGRAADGVAFELSLPLLLPLNNNRSFVLLRRRFASAVIFGARCSDCATHQQLSEPNGIPFVLTVVCQNKSRASNWRRTHQLSAQPDAATPPRRTA